MQEPWEMWVRSLGQKDPLKKEMTTHSSLLAWKVPWTEEPGELQSIGLQRVGYDWACTHTSIYSSVVLGTLLAPATCPLHPSPLCWPADITLGAWPLYFLSGFSALWLPLGFKSSSSSRRWWEEARRSKQRRRQMSLPSLLGHRLAGTEFLCYSPHLLSERFHLQL